MCQHTNCAQKLTAGVSRYETHYYNTGLTAPSICQANHCARAINSYQPRTPPKLTAHVNNDNLPRSRVCHHLVPQPTTVFLPNDRNFLASYPHISPSPNLRNPIYLPLTEKYYAKYLKRFVKRNMETQIKLT